MFEESNEPPFLYFFYAALTLAASAEVVAIGLLVSWVVDRWDEPRFRRERELRAQESSQP